MAVMTVTKLRELLTALEDEGYGDLKVIMSKDAEGNNYSPMPEEDAHCIGVYKPNTSWYGDYTSDPEEVGRKKKNALCLWPTN